MRRAIGSDGSLNSTMVRLKQHKVLKTIARHKACLNSTMVRLKPTLFRSKI